ncbi:MULTISPECIES: aegerolysin family protein [Pseudomonas aeruginosa group]|nr:MULTISPECIES: aegerolysin family protein [Pseudomonas aeruginosa group]
MAYAEWIAVKVVVSNSIGTAGIRNATLQWGMFCRCSNRDDEISAEKDSSMNVQAGSPQWIASCGRENAASGTRAASTATTATPRWVPSAGMISGNPAPSTPGTSRRRRRTTPVSTAAATPPERHRRGHPDSGPLLLTAPGAGRRSAGQLRRPLPRSECPPQRFDGDLHLGRLGITPRCHRVDPQVR